jgi:hypothetical protein
MPLPKPLPKFISRLLMPPRQERLWVTLLWTLTLSVGSAGWDWSERQFQELALPQRLVLLSKGTLDDRQRQEVRGKLLGEPGIGGVQWISPADLTHQVSRRFPQAEWQGLFPADGAWLPWVLEVHPADPLSQSELIRAFVARREQEGSWRLVLWDPEPLQRLIGERLTVRVVLGFWLILAALSGAVALLRIPWPEQGGLMLLAWSMLAGLMGPAAVWAAAWLLAPQELDIQCLGIALAVGFILATVVAPVLRHRRRKSLSLEISEAPNERAWQDTGSGK